MFCFAKHASMVVKSFVRHHLGLVPIEVEVALVPGLPTINILGLPDKIIQESAKRIQTAILNQGYKLPKAKQILVNLWPREMRKTSLGLDLAIALAILHETGQKNILDELPCDYIYGELNFLGEVRAPHDIPLLESVAGTVLTGLIEVPIRKKIKTISQLKDEATNVFSSEENLTFVRPHFLFPTYDQKVADLITLAAHGEHSVLLAGPPGSGKSAFVNSILSFLNPPTESQFREMSPMTHYFKQDHKWRPSVKPHHTSTHLSFVGGGVPPKPGEIVRAHHGVLILDELLEFDPSVQAALREPMENHCIHLARADQRMTYPCEFMTLATTNLCACGEYIPSSYKMCRCSSRDLRLYQKKLSGPFVDRFSILQLTEAWYKKMTLVSADKILNDIQLARDFQIKERKQQKLNEKLSAHELDEFFKNKILKSFMPNFRSQRRELSVLRVARSIADLQQKIFFDEECLSRALDFSFYGFEQIKKME